MSSYDVPFGASSLILAAILRLCLCHVSDGPIKGVRLFGENGNFAYVSPCIAPLLLHDNHPCHHTSFS